MARHGDQNWGFETQPYTLLHANNHPHDEGLVAHGLFSINVPVDREDYPFFSTSLVSRVVDHSILPQTQCSHVFSPKCLAWCFRWCRADWHGKYWTFVLSHDSQNLWTNWRRCAGRGSVVWALTARDLVSGP